MKGVKNKKKQYVKPELYFENFELSANIATQCADTSIKAPIQFGGKNIFVSQIECTDTLTEEEEGNTSYCYHVPTETSKLFSS